MSANNDDAQSQHLTLSKNAAIIAALYAAEAKDKRNARLAVKIQLLFLIVASGLGYVVLSTWQYVAAIIAGGAISVVNGAMLSWRMSNFNARSSESANEQCVANFQLRLMYYYAAERFMVVIALLGLGLAVLKLIPFALLSGFVVGQVVLIVSQLILSRFKPG